MNRSIHVYALLLIGLAVSPARVTGQSSGQSAPMNADSLAAARDSAMQSVLRTIAGREREPAESVFTNIRALRGMPARRLPRVMNLGYARSLGVGCDHCHLPGEWESEDKPQKEIARQMMAMADTINRRMLPNIANLRSAQPVVNCTTCHRGSVKPAIEMPPTRE